MKISDAILKGVAMYPQKAKHVFHNKKRRASCVYGAALDGLGYKTGKDEGDNLIDKVLRADEAFTKAYGASMVEVNDYSVTSREEIAGMLQAIRR